MPLLNILYINRNWNLGAEDKVKSPRIKKKNANLTGKG